MHRIFQNIYESIEFPKLKLLARALERAELLENGEIIVSHITRADFDETGAEAGASEGIIDSLRAVEGTIMAVLIQEPTDRPGMRVSLRAAHGDIDVSAIAREVVGRRPPPGGRLLEPGHGARDHRVHPLGVRRRPQRRRPRRALMPPRGLEPAGLVLVDKPDGPSSFAVVRQLRSATGARAGHAGTLDPFATGLLLVLLGAATRLAQYLVGLDKRYETLVDLRCDDGVRRPAGRAPRGARPSARGRARAPARSAARHGRAPRSGRLGGQDRG